MNLAEYEKMFRLETSHWWFEAMRFNYMRRVRPCFRQGDSVLDVGMGTGIVCVELRQMGLHAVGVDVSAEALTYATRRKGLSCVRSMGEVLPFKNGSFAGVMCFDTLEHVADDKALLAAVKRVLAPAGTLVLSVPAHPALFGAHDRALGHYRRYSRESLARILSESQFSVISLEWLNVTLFPLIAGIRRTRNAMHGERQSAASDMSETLAPVNVFLKAIVKAEAYWTRLAPGLPGLSLLAVARNT